MAKQFRYFVFFFSLLQILSCDTKKAEPKESELHGNLENVFGLYSYYVTGYNSHCETIKHLLRLNQDSTFIYKIYCYADSTSPFKSTVKTGKWTKTSDSLLHLICSDVITFDVEIMQHSQLKIIPAKGQERFNYVFKKDTSIQNQRTL